MVSAKITLPILIISCFIVIGASLTGILILWLPIQDFPAKYTASPLPSVAYAYNNNANTAQCCAYGKDVFRTIYLCNGRGNDPCGEGKTSTLSSTALPTSSPPPRFYLYKYSGEQAEFTPSSFYSENYPISTAMPTTVTVTVGGGAAGASSTVTQMTTTVRSSASAFASATGSRSRSSGYLYSYSSSSRAISSYLSGYVVSTSASPPIQTTFNIHIPRPVYPSRIYMTVYQSIALAFVLMMLIQLFVNFIIAWRSLNPNRKGQENNLEAEEENKNELPPPYSATPNHDSIPSRFLFSIRSDEQENDEQDQREENQSRLMKSCNLLTPSALGGMWLWLIIPLWIMSIAAIGIQGTNFRDLQAFLDAGACGKTTYLYSTWERIICGGYPSDKPYVYTADPSNKSLTIGNYAWPLVVSISMFVVIFIGLWIFFISFIIRMKDASKRFQRTFPQRELVTRQGDLVQSRRYNPLPFFTFVPFSNFTGVGSSDGGSSGGGGGYSGGFGGGGGGGCGGGDGGGGGGGGCC